MICIAISMEVTEFLTFVATLYWEMVIDLATGKLTNAIYMLLSIDSINFRMLQLTRMMA